MKKELYGAINQKRFEEAHRLLTHLRQWKHPNKVFVGLNH